MIELPTSETKYALYNYIAAAANVDPFQAPWAINYVTDLVITPAKERKIVLGEVTEITYYAGYDLETREYGTPLVREIFKYFREPEPPVGTGWATYRTQEAYFFLENGELGPHPKVFTPKVYGSVGEKRKEIERKKRNQTSRAAEVAVGALMGAGFALSEATKAGQSYWASLVSEIALYEQGNPFPLRDRIGNDATPEWLPAIKQFILAELA